MANHPEIIRLLTKFMLTPRRPVVIMDQIVEF
jgi:hypothetical protein